MRLPPNLLAMIANDAPLAVIADVLEEVSHPWLEMVNAFMAGKEYVEAWLIDEIEMRGSRVPQANVRCRFPSHFPRNQHGGRGRGSVSVLHQPHQHQYELRFTYSERDMYDWAKEEWDRVRLAYSFRAHVNEDGLIVADEDIPKGGVISNTMARLAMSGIR